MYKKISYVQITISWNNINMNTHLTNGFGSNLFLIIWYYDINEASQRAFVWWVFFVWILFLVILLFFTITIQTLWAINNFMCQFILNFYILMTIHFLVFLVAKLTFVNNLSVVSTLYVSDRQLGKWLIHSCLLTDFKFYKLNI